jgi:hypothetical protein
MPPEESFKNIRNRHLREEMYRLVQKDRHITSIVDMTVPQKNIVTAYRCLLRRCRARGFFVDTNGGPRRDEWEPGKNRALFAGQNTRKDNSPHVSTIHSLARRTKTGERLVPAARLMALIHEYLHGVHFQKVGLAAWRALCYSDRDSRERCREIPVYKLTYEVGMRFVTSRDLDAHLDWAESRLLIEEKNASMDPRWRLDDGVA